MTTQPARVPDLLVEQLAAGELDATRAADVRARLEAEPDGLARLAEIERSNKEVLEQISAENVAREVAIRAARRPAPAKPDPTDVRAWFAWGGPMMALAMVFLVAWPVVRPVVSDVQDDGIRFKGLDAGLRVYRHSEGLAKALSDGDAAYAGDVLQLAYLAHKHRFGVLLSVDGSDVVTVHFPTDGRGSTVLDRPGEILLDHAYQLDDAPGFERFVLVLGNTPLSVDAIRQQAASNGGAGPFVDADGRRLETVDMTLRKEGG